MSIVNFFLCFFIVDYAYFRIVIQMNYKVLYENSDASLIDRLLQARGITDSPSDFLNPSFTRYRQSPSQLNDIEKALDRIQLAIANNEKIMVFGDYDVDGVTASYVVYTYFKKFLWYNNISIRLPHRLKDWYGIKSYHLDEIHAAGVSLVITVDNGITAVVEADYAKKLWIDLIITDHHKQLDKIPDGFAVINPHISPKMRFTEMCGATVAFKVMRWLTERIFDDRITKESIFQFFLPIVAIASVADCMPLIDENRLLVKTWLDYINTWKSKPLSLRNFIDYLNIKWPLDTYHIWFLLAPRINAGWRVMTPYDSLYTLLHTWDKQLAYLQNLDDLNTKRKKIQDDMMKIAEWLIDLQAPVIVVWSVDFHEWVIWIVAGRLCEKYHRPTVVYGINTEEWIAVASCRGPEFASIIDMLYSQAPLLDRYGWHKQAWWLTMKLENIDSFVAWVCEFALQYGVQEKRKIVTIDTILYPQEYNTASLAIVNQLAPFWQANAEPMFLIPNATVVTVEKVWKNWKGHMKLRARYENIQITCMFWWSWNEIDSLLLWSVISIAGKLQKDDFNGWVYLVGEDWVVHE